MALLPVPSQPEGAFREHSVRARGDSPLTDYSRLLLAAGTRRAPSGARQTATVFESGFDNEANATACTARAALRRASSCGALRRGLGARASDAARVRAFRR